MRLELLATRLALRSVELLVMLLGLPAFLLKMIEGYENRTVQDIFRFLGKPRTRSVLCYWVGARWNTGEMAVSSKPGKVSM
jgi:hypothetical protein